MWHANTIRFILETGQASPTHMGELRNVETHEALYYPSTFHALASVFSHLTGAAPTTAYTLNSLAAAIWLFPVSAATLTWQLLRTRTDEWRTAGAAATAAALSASFTAIPYVEFDTASMPNLAAYGMAVPTMALVVSALRHRDRIPLAVLALLGVFSVHITGGVVVVLFVAAWWLVDALWRPVRGRVADFVNLLLIAIPTVVLLLPQFLGVLQQAEIIVGHAFVTHEGKKRGLIDAMVQHTRHLNDFPIQWVLIILAAIGAVVLLVRRIWWPLAVWLLLVVSIVHSSAPFGGPIGTLTGKFSDLFYSDPRRLSAVITMLLTAAVGIAVFTLASAVVAGARRLVDKGSPRAWNAATAAIVVAVSVGIGLAYLPRAPVPVRREVRQGARRRQGPGGMGVSGHPARGARHPDRRREHRRHGVDVRRRRPAPAVDPLRLPGPAGSGLSPVHLLGVRRRRRHRPASGRGGEGTQHPVRGHEHTGGPRVRHARRASVARYVAVVEEDLRQRRGPHLRMARRGDMTANTDDDNIEIIGGDDSLVADDDADGKSLTDLVEQPAKVMRIGTMIKQLLEEVRAAPLDDASRNRLRDIHRTSIRELEDGLAPELREELERLTLPFTEDKVPSDAELRIAQAQLVGWLEGLFHGIQTALFAQQMAARQQLEQMRQLPPGAAVPGQRGGGVGTGQYL